jgi:hypothetical protein
MGTQCCASDQGACEEQAVNSSCGEQTSCCPSTAADPFAAGVEMWKSAMRQAFTEVQVDILKPKIQKAWGPLMDKVADAALESMGVCWQSAIAQAKAKEDFQAKLKKLWQEGK